jgi:hypothetical protein
MIMPKYGLNSVSPEEWDKVARNAKAVETKAIYAQMAEEEQHQQQQQQDEDLVNSPRHYTSGSIETIDAIKAALSPSEYRGFLKANCLKYIWREGKKSNKSKEDLLKAKWYLERLLSI